MTTIVWDGKHVYADSQVTFGSMKGTMTKVLRVPSPEGPAVVAVAGEVDILSRVVAAVASGDPVSPLVSGNSSVLVVKAGVCTVFSVKKSWTEEAPVFLGSGAPTARGAYYVSKSAAQALAAACATDLYSCGPIRKVRT